MTIHGIGAGGAGFYLWPALARAGVKDVVVYDSDDMSGGLGYTRLPAASASMKKVNLLRGFVLAVMGDGAIGVVDHDFNGDNVRAGDLVVDCSDMPGYLRRPIWAKCREAGARCLRVSYDGLNNTVVVAEGLPLRDDSKGSYAAVPSLALSFMAGGVGAIAVQKILSGYQDHIEFQISLSDFIKEVPSVQTQSGNGLSAHSPESRDSSHAA